MEILLRKLSALQKGASAIDPDRTLLFVKRRVAKVLMTMKAIGRNNALESYEKRKLGIFNIFNFFQIVTGLLVPLIGYLAIPRLSLYIWIIAALPVLVSALSLYLNYRRNYELALITYFILYPFFTCVVYINGINLGTDLNFVLYGILSVFFLQNLGYMLFSVAFSMLSYFLLAIVLSDFRYDLSQINQPFYLANQLLVIAYIFYGLWLIKKENTGYQGHILSKNKSLQKQNVEIDNQKREISHKAEILKTQTIKLAKLNNVKSKLFSVISHDLKTPMYALRNIFRNINEQKIPAKDIKAMMPDVLEELNYSINLMENLLHWAKSQMQSDTARKEEVDISQAIEIAIGVAHAQAQVKGVHVVSEVEESICVVGDRERVNIVLRNLLSNAIKFTPVSGTVRMGISLGSQFAEVYVQDAGDGISEENISKIQQFNFHTTNGTAGESGTGLGLMLCQEFLKSMGSEIQIHSKKGEGSKFSFFLPLVGADDREQAA